MNKLTKMTVIFICVIAMVLWIPPSTGVVSAAAKNGCTVKVIQPGYAALDDSLRCQNFEERVASLPRFLVDYLKESGCLNTLVVPGTSTGTGSGAQNPACKPTPKPTTPKPAPEETSKPTTPKPTPKPTTPKPAPEETSKPTTPKPTPKPTPEETSKPSEPSTGTTVSEYAAEVVRLVNQERAAQGLAALTVDASTQKAAQVRAIEIKTSFSHTRPNGTSAFTALAENGVSYRTAGENIAYGQSSPAQVMNGWMNSSGHRANIMNPSYKHIGVGVYQDSSGRLYWTQFFIG